MSENEKKEIEPIFTEKCLYCIQYGSTRHFDTKRPDIVQNFGDIRKHLKQISTCYNFKMFQFFL